MSYYQPYVTVRDVGISLWKRDGTWHWQLNNIGHRARSLRRYGSAASAVTAFFAAYRERRRMMEEMGRPD